MAETTHAVIIIQARTGSQRFPSKCLADLDGKPVLQHVIDACRSSAFQFAQHTPRSGLMASVCLAIPEGDTELYRFRSSCPVIEGPEKDVLARYASAAEKMGADYICRITGDCPLIIGPMINHAIKTAHKNHYDYFSNVDEAVRVVPDGWDVEVFSRRLLDFAHKYATDEDDREHVTKFMRRCPPHGYTSGFQSSFIGAALADLKLSIDETVDLDRVIPLARKSREMYEAAVAKFGKTRVHRF